MPTLTGIFGDDIRIMDAKVATRYSYILKKLGVIYIKIINLPFWLC